MLKIQAPDSAAVKDCSSGGPAPNMASFLKKPGGVSNLGPNEDYCQDLFNQVNSKIDLV